MSTSARDGYHHGDLRSALLDAASEMLEAGEPFSLRAVARRAGVSQTAPYRHFADREALESALAVRGFQELRERLSFDGSPAASEDELIGFAITYVSFALERPAVFKLMFGQECDDSGDERVVAATALRELLADSLRDVSLGADREALATALWALTHGLAFLHLDGKLPADSAETVAARVRAALTAIRPPHRLAGSNRGLGMTRRILHVVTNVGSYDGPGAPSDEPDRSDHPTGLWLSELTHAWELFEAAGFEQTLVSPAGGAVPLEPRSLKFPNLDRSAKQWLADPAKPALLERTASPEQIDATGFDAIYFTGGHAVMYDFPDSAGLQRITREIFEQGGVVSSVCHGYCGLLNTRLSDGSYLIAGREMTGFSWREEELAGVADLVPYNAEATAGERGARYRKAKLPFVSYAVTDGTLVTGQNPGSAKATARRVSELLR